MSAFVLAASVNAFVVAGGILAAWAVIVALLGMRGFPKNRGGERLAIGITVVLFVGTIGSAILDTTKVGERHGPEVEEAEAAEGKGEGRAEPGEQQSGQEAATGEGSGSAPTDQGEQTGEAGKPTALTLNADPSGATRFDKATLTADAGEVSITMTNESPVPHNVAIRGNGVDEEGDVVQGNAKSTVEATLEPGLSYEFYCSVPGHEQGGMKGTLNVR
jgi:plastocyanin